MMMSNQKLDLIPPRIAVLGSGYLSQVERGIFSHRLPGHRKLLSE
jgi:hypothetical protein